MQPTTILLHLLFFNFLGLNNYFVGCKFYKVEFSKFNSTMLKDTILASRKYHKKLFVLGIV